MTGSITLSWKLPDWPAIVIVASLPMTCAHTIVTASGITGLTLPGMIDEPGCSAVSSISREPGERARVHPAQVVRDLHQRARERAHLAGELDRGILRRDVLEEIVAGLEGGAR